MMMVNDNSRRCHKLECHSRVISYTPKVINYTRVINYSLESSITLLESSITPLESSITLLESPITLLESSITLLESSITHTERIYSAGITHEDCHMTVMICSQYRLLVSNESYIDLLKFFRLKYCLYMRNCYDLTNVFALQCQYQTLWHSA